MNYTIRWFVEIWDKFCLWASTQPTFVEVAIGVGLFYVILLVVRAIYRFTVFLIAGLFSGRSRYRGKRDTKPQGRTKPTALDDEAPPFIFR
jgi:hypothetical protein